MKIGSFKDLRGKFGALIAMFIVTIMAMACMLIPLLIVSAFFFCVRLVLINGMSVVELFL